MSAANVEETLKDFWAYRPRRPHDGRKIAGVAAGIAQRYQIDPVVVRVAFVAMALCNGAGILVYLLGWLCFAQADDEVSPAEALLGRGRSSTPTALTVLLGLAVIPATGVFVDGGFTMVGGVLLSVGGIYLLHRGRGQLNRPAATREPTSVFPAPDPAFDVVGVPVQHQEQTTGRTTPPAWDPLGAAPFAWDLPDPAAAAPAPVPVAPRPPRRRSRVGVVTFGLAMIVLAVAAALSREVAWLTPTHTIGLLVGVLGAGMVVGALRGGGGRGLTWLVVPLALVGVVGTAVDFDGIRSGRMGSIRDRPTTVEQVDQRYEAGIGEVDLDLTGLPGSGTVSTAVDLGLGSAKVRVPKDADVTVTCGVELGSVNCLGKTSDGKDVVERASDDGPDGPGGLKVVLDVRSEIGDVEVSRG
ncbi:PspC domain-containing protein [Saccharothrix syringae]|uniref:PspC domain-containing protein n=1 Tax=Saccharothrix syringae TaxID=103733 RepID=A0A5Q0HFR4_SACSY|nr:PspC domain-containing protein [Saccharothrix syringae]